MRAHTLSFLSLLSLAAAASSLQWGSVRPVRCDEGTACRAGGCGFQDCAAPPPAACRGGGCMFINCTAPTCDGGGCKFVDCSAPECRGGGCDFARTQTMLLDGWCAGGGCTVEGHAAQHKRKGDGASF